MPLDIDAEIKKLIDKHSKLWKLSPYKRNEILHRAGKPAPENYFIKSGIVKAYIYNESMDEVIVGFFAEGESVLPYKGKDFNLPTIVNLQVIEDAEIYAISNNHYDKLIEEEPIFKQLLHQDFYRMAGKLIKLLLVYSYTDAQTRYNEAVKIYPFLRRLRDEEVVSHLGFSKRTVTNVKAGKGNK